jgi:fatty-acyl-CoA synthase
MAQARREDFSLLARLSSEVSSEDLAFILYTSGTTAFPKGAMRTQGSCLGMAYYMTTVPFRLTEQDLMLVFSPFFHIGGCIYNTLGSHLSGCPILLMKSFDPGQALELIHKYRVTFLGGFETHFHRLLKHPRFSSTDVSSVTKVRLATGPQWYDIVRQSGLGREIIAHHYGFTEGTGVVMPAEETDYETRRNANGKPFPGVELKITDPQTGQREPVGTPGEICLKGWTLFKGYYKMPKETQDAMDEEGFFHTGDYGWLDEKGYLYYRGRYKQMVKTGGENVSQREVEIFLEGHPDIQAVQVIGLPDPEWGESVTAVIQTRSGQNLSLEQVKQFSKGKLSGFKIPKRVLIIQEQEWPITRVGKVDKIQLRRWAMRKIGIKE